MPILFENRHYYKAPAFIHAREQVLKRAGDKCEFCGVKNKTEGYWLNDHFSETLLHVPLKTILIVLTVAHLDHDPANNDLDNLRALCQRCHNRHDAKDRAKNRKLRVERRERQMELF